MAALLVEDALEICLLLAAVVRRVPVDASPTHPAVVLGHMGPGDIQRADGAHGNGLVLLPRHGDHPLSLLDFEKPPLVYTEQMFYTMEKRRDTCTLPTGSKRSTTCANETSGLPAS